MPTPTLPATSTPTDPRVPHLLGVPEVADALGLSIIACRRLIARHGLPTIRMHRRVLVDTRDLAAYIDQHRTP